MNWKEEYDNLWRSSKIDNARIIDLPDWNKEPPKGEFIPTRGHIIENNHFYTDLEMIKRNVELIKMRLNSPEKGCKVIDGTPTFTMTSLEEVVNDVLIGLNNTIKEGYKMVKDGQ